MPLAIAAGFFAARRRNTLADRTVVTLGLASSSIPEFVSGVTLQYLLGVKLGWFPAAGAGAAGSSLLTAAQPPHRCRRSPWSSSTSATSPG